MIHSLNERFQKDDQNFFHIGEQLIPGIVLEENIHSLENTRMLICQDNLEDKNFYLSTLSNTDISIRKPIKIQLECEIFRVLMKLVGERCLSLVLKSIEENGNFNYNFNFDVYLTAKLKKESLSSYPAFYYKNSNAKDINFLISSFCFRENSPLKVLSNKFDQSIDSKIYTENSDTTEFKNAHDSLFDLIHSLNNKHDVTNDMEIDLIQEKSNLIPLLRPYQINAVKWMLLKENFKLSRLDASLLSEDIEVILFKI